MSYHKRDVDSPHNVHLGVTDWLLRHKHKTLWVQSVDLGAVLQERYVLPWPVFPVCGIRHSARGLVFISPCSNKLKCVKCKMPQNSQMRPTHISNPPVSIWSNLLNSCLSACQEFLRIGNIEEVIFHINRWGWVLPRLEHLASFR